MKRQAKRLIVLGLIISLASMSMLSEVSKANEINKVQGESLTLLSMDIDKAMQSVEVDKLSMDDFALTILEQPDIVDLEVMEDLPEHQQTIQENAEAYLKDIKQELIDLNERSILIAEYMRLYNDFFVSEIQKVQENNSDEKEIRQNIQEGLQDLEVIIEDEIAEVKDTHKKTEDFLVDFEEDYQAFETSVVEAEEYVIEQESYKDEQIEQLEEELHEEIRIKKETDVFKVLLATFGIAASMVGGFAYIKHSAKLANQSFFKYVIKSQKLLVLGELALPAFIFGFGDFTKVTAVYETHEQVDGLQKELLLVKVFENQANGLMSTKADVVSSLDDLTSEWSVLKGNIQMMSEMMMNEDLNNLKTKFEGASSSWENTKDVSRIYQQLEENKLDSLEIDFDEIETEEDYEEVLKDTYDVDELINIPDDLTEEELEEWLYELLDT